MSWQAHQVAYLVRGQVAVGMTSIIGSARRAPARRVGTTRTNGAQGRRSRPALTHVVNRHPVAAPRATPVARGGAARRGKIRRVKQLFHPIFGSQNGGQKWGGNHYFCGNCDCRSAA